DEEVVLVVFADLSNVRARGQVHAKLARGKGRLAAGRLRRAGVLRAGLRGCLGLRHEQTLILSPDAPAARGLRGFVQKVDAKQLLPDPELVAVRELDVPANA